MKKALLVGVNHYDDGQIRNLNYAIKDACALGWMFSKLGYDTTVLKNPSQMDVENKIRKLTDNMRRGDQFLFYFSGHGFTDDGRHLLFCADDKAAMLRHRRAGFPFGLIEEMTAKRGFDRVFMLDACRSDFLVGVKGSMERTLGEIGGMTPKNRIGAGAYYILRSCSPYECAYEIDEKKHGLFTLALMKVLLNARINGQRLHFNDALREMIIDQMSSIQDNLTNELDFAQTPESIGGGVFTDCLLDGDNPPNVPPPVTPQPPPPQPQRVTRLTAEPLRLFNAFACLLVNKDNNELQGFLERFQNFVPVDPTVLNWRMADTPRIIDDEENLLRLLGEIRAAHERQARRRRPFFIEAYRQNFLILLKDSEIHNRFLEEMRRCVDLTYNYNNEEE